MKEMIIKVATTVIKVLALYVFVMSAIVSGCLGAARPVLGFGALAIAIFLLFMAESVDKGGKASDGGPNET